MPHDELASPELTEPCERVLSAYSAEASVQKTLDPQHDGWVSRLRRIDGIDDEDLPALHGRLIAHGLLKIQLAGRKEGVRYQLSGAAKQSLAREATAATP